MTIINGCLLTNDTFGQTILKNGECNNSTERLPLYYYHHYMDLKKKNSTIATKYPVPHKIDWNGIPTQNSVDRPHIAIRRIPGMALTYQQEECKSTTI
jgi:hypothetical protein